MKKQMLLFCSLLNKDKSKTNCQMERETNPCHQLSHGFHQIFLATIEWKKANGLRSIILCVFVTKLVSGEMPPPEEEVTRRKRREHPQEKIRQDMVFFLILNKKEDIPVNERRAHEKWRPHNFNLISPLFSTKK